MSRWRGKWALVTGASAGIGWALAEELAAEGANLVLTARRGDRLEALARQLTEARRIEIEMIAADLSQPEAPAEIFAFTEKKGITVDLLVNNAGFGIYGEFHQLEPGRLFEMIQVNVAAVVHLTRLYLPQMVARHSGDILIVASTAAFQAVPYISCYAATKAFDLILAEGLAEEVRRYGVRVCALCPGSTETEFQQVAGQPDRTFRYTEAPKKVARVGLCALERGKSHVISGLANYLMTQSERIAPRRLVTRMAAEMFRPAEQPRERG
jgi:short-subunit dehydrogenase